jgi:hypothetical protein
MPLQSFENFQHVVIREDGDNMPTLVNVGHISILTLRRNSAGNRYAQVILSNGHALVLTPSEGLRLIGRLGHPVDPDETVDDL